MPIKPARWGQAAGIRLATHKPLTFLLSAVETGLVCMEDVRDVTELVGERVDKAGLCNVGPSAWCGNPSVHDKQMSVPLLKPG